MHFTLSILVYDQAHYGFDGFDFLLSEMRLNDWTPTAVEPPEWQASSTLVEPPLCGDDPFDSRGFVALAGNLIVPYFGTLEGTSGVRPELRVLGWHDYVEFTERPKAKRVWDLLVTEHTYEFDLVYAHHHTLHTGIFADFRQDDFTPASTLASRRGRRPCAPWPRRRSHPCPLHWPIHSVAQWYNNGSPKSGMTQSWASSMLMC